MMRDTLIVHVNDVLKNDCTALIDGQYVPARSVGFSSWLYRLKATWLVFTGKAFVIN